MTQVQLSRVGLGALLLALGATLSCGDAPTTPTPAPPPPPPPPPPVPATVTVSPASASLTALGDTVRFAAEVRDQFGQTMTGAAVSWSSGNASVAEVDAAGLVTAAGLGEAEITATSGDASGAARVAVTQTPDSVAVSPDSATLAVGDTLRLAAVAFDANGHAVAGAAFAWASSHPAVAAVDTTGLVTAAGPGEAEITATSGDASSAARVAVTQTPDSVAVSPASATLAVGDTLRLEAVAFDANGHAIAGAAFAWASSHPAVAAVDATGLVTAAGPGEAEIAAASGDASGAARVAVTQTPDSVAVFPASATLAVGDTLRLEAVAFDANGHAIAGATFAWSSTDPAVAAVDTTGLVTGLAEGSSTITGSSGAVAASSEITVIVDSSDDRAALVALYEATGGPNWVNRDNWLTDAPLGEWYGVVTDTRGRVTELRLWLNGLTGELPPEIGSLSQLVLLNLAQNPLTGPIPPEIGLLSKLEFLAIIYTTMSGPIPPELGDLSALQILIIAQTAVAGPGVDGPIPPELGRLTRLRELSLHGNRLIGPIPPELGNLIALETLWLGVHPKHGRGHTGSIPPELGNLAALSNLRITGSSLNGPIPPELGRLAKLTNLHLSGNSLTGALPPELADLSGLKVLDLSINDLAGPVPASFGDLTVLESLNLAQNPGLAGALPPSLTGLTRLRALLTTGTDLCAPADEGFLGWLNSIVRKRLPPCATGDAADVYLTQAVQSREYPVGLVAGDPALLRVFVAEPRASGVNMPPVRATFFLDGAEARVVEIPGQGTPIPAEVEEGDLSKSANAAIPGDFVQPGLELVVEIDPDGTLDPSLGVGRRIPPTGRMALDVRRVPTLPLTMVPFLWSEAPDSTILELAAGLSPEDSLFWMTRDLLPVRDLELSIHEPVVTSATAAFELGRQARLIRAAEGGTGYWWATTSGYFEGSPGLSFGDGVFWATPYPRVVAHELGHEFGLDHAPCGGAPSPDAAYPEADGSIGVWGYDGRAGELVPPRAADLMGYCPPAWISDYHFSNALAYRVHVEGEVMPTGGPAAPAILLWGGADGEGRPYLEPAFVTDAPPSLPRGSGGAYSIAGRGSGGEVLFSFRFDLPETADGDGSASFAFALPADPRWAGSLASITLTGPGGSETLDGNTDRPMAILRDPASGRIRGFLREPPSAVQATRDLAGQTAGPGLEVLFSRGIPDAAAWRR